MERISTCTVPEDENNLVQTILGKWRSHAQGPTWGPFLETPDNSPGPKTIFGAQYSEIAIQFSLILKAKF